MKDKRFPRVIRWLWRSCLCIGLAWILSFLIAAAIQRCERMYISLDFRAEHGSFTSLRLLFAPDSEEEMFEEVYPSGTADENTWQNLRFSLPRYRARSIRLGFSSASDTVFLRNIRIDGKTFPPVLLNDADKRNVQTLNPPSAEDDAVSVRIAGKGAYIVLPQEYISPVHPIKWYACFWFYGIWFLLSFMIGVMYDKLCRILRLGWKRLYPSGLIYGTLAGFFACYGGMKWHAFSLRILGGYFEGSFADFLTLFHMDGLTLAAFAAGYTFLFGKTRANIAKSVVFICLGAVLVVQITDAALVQLLNARFAFGQLAAAGPGIWSAWPMAFSFFRSPAGMYALGTVFLYVALGGLSLYHMLSVQARKVLGIWAAFNFMFYFLLPFVLPADERETFKDWPRTVWTAAFRLRGVSAPAAATFRPEYTCQKGLNGRQNVIIVLVESLSSYMSAHFSGLNAHTPQLDRLARENLAFTNYSAAGHNTVQGLFNLVTGFPSVYLLTETAVFTDPRFYGRSLPKTFHRAGYHTAFFTSASYVYGKDDILKRAGFDEISNDQDPFYQDKKRFVFHSVSDDVLYARTKKWLQTPPHIPYLLVLETTTSHAPYTDPVSLKESFPRALRFADKELGDFVSFLQQSGFFNDGLLVITGDHRAMLPLTPEQTALWGASAEERVPLVVIGKGLKGQVGARASHTDLGPSLAYLTLPEACFHAHQENLLALQKPRRSCTMFQSYVFSKQVWAQCGEDEAVIELGAGNLSALTSLAEPARQAELEAFITWLRDGNRY